MARGLEASGSKPRADAYPTQTHRQPSSQPASQPETQAHEKKIAKRRKKTQDQAKRRAEKIKENKHHYRDEGIKKSVRKMWDVTPEGTKARKYLKRMAERSPGELASWGVIWHEPFSERTGRAKNFPEGVFERLE